MAGVGCAKCFTFFFNLLFGLSGLLILLIGAMVQFNYSHYSNFVSDHVWTAPIILMIVGAVIAFASFLGCCGALSENSCMILTYVLLAIIIFLAEIGLGIAGYVKHSSLQNVMESQFNTTMIHYNEREDYQDAWKLLQSEMHCCGTYGANDWENILHNKTLPASCCDIINLQEAEECTAMHAHKEGCLNVLLNLLGSKAAILAGAAFGVAAIQVLTIVFGCCLIRAF